MQSRLINQAGQQRTFVVVLNSGDEVTACLNRFVEQEKIEAAQFSAIGAFRSAVLSYFDWKTKSYQRIPVNEQVEVAARLRAICWRVTFGRRLRSF
jgi:predicted DNA-binding protein with PD1-like motif